MLRSLVGSEMCIRDSGIGRQAKSTISPLQRVQNAAVRLILGLRARDHVTPAVRQLHWLPVHQRIQHKLPVCTMMHSIHHGMCPAYLADTVSAITENPVCADSKVYRLPRYRTRPWVSVHSPTPTHSHGTLCLQHSVTLPSACTQFRQEALLSQRGQRVGRA